jgi:hypothetical protein
VDSDFSLLADKPASRLFSTLYPGAGEDPCFSGKQQQEPEAAILWGSRSRRQNRMSAGCSVLELGTSGAFPLCCHDLAMHRRRIYPMLTDESDVS